MLTLMDGPANGTYAVKRAPQWLRGVVDEDGNTDVLDQLDDEPKPTESVYVYELRGGSGIVHVNRGGRGSGFYASGTYHHLPIVDGEALRETTAWQEWVMAQTSRPIDPETGAFVEQPGT